jgi:hypothetical protein
MSQQYSIEQVLKNLDKIFQRIEQYLLHIVQPNISILPYDNVGAEWFALERARLVTIGKTPAYPDRQIAAIAKVNGLILVTNNVSDYADFQELFKMAKLLLIPERCLSSGA